MRERASRGSSHARGSLQANCSLQQKKRVSSWAAAFKREKTRKKRAVGVRRREKRVFFDAMIPRGLLVRSQQLLRGVRGVTKFAKSHEWVSVKGDVGTVGITVRH